jgi:hypothetical protein
MYQVFKDYNTKHGKLERMKRPTISLVNTKLEGVYTTTSQSHDVTKIFSDLERFSAKVAFTCLTCDKKVEPLQHYKDTNHITYHHPRAQIDSIIDLAAVLMKYHSAEYTPETLAILQTYPSNPLN